MADKMKQAEASPSSKTQENWKTKLRKEMRWNKKLIVLKLVLFFFQGGSTGFLPYLTLHMQQLGITVKEIAVMYAFLPIASLLGPPTSGLISDKFGTLKLVVIINIILTTIFHCSLLYVPARVRNPLTLTTEGREFHLKWDSCDYCHEDRNGTHLNLIIQNCKFLCETPPLDPKLCFHTSANITKCQDFSLNEQISVNGTILSSRHDDTCSHHWYDLLHEDETYHRLRNDHDCAMECEVKGMPHCDHPDDLSNTPDTFWIYFTLRMIGTFFLASAFTMLDATTLAVIQDHDGDFGKQRVLNMIGQAVVPLISGILIDYHSRSIGYSDYMPALYLGASFNMVAAAMVWKIEFKMEKAGSHLLADLRKLMIRPKVDAFLAMILVLGCNWGFIESYLFVYLIELNAPNYMLGLTLTVGCIVGVPIMYVTDALVNKVGRHTVFIFSFATYAIRQFGYANITNPWWVFPFEMLEVFTYQIMWVAAVTTCPLLAPKSLLATMTGLSGAIHYSMGRGIGALLGGYLIANHGLTFAFNFFGYLCIAGGSVYTIVYFAYIRRHYPSNVQEKPGKPLTVGEDKPMIEKKINPVIIISSEPDKQQSVDV